MRRRGEPSAHLVVAGRRPVAEALDAGAITELLVADGARPGGELDRLLAAARSAQVPVRRVPRQRLESLAGDVAHQGVAALVRPHRELTEADLGSPRWGPDDLVVVLDGVSDPRNLGAVARTAEAAGAAALVVRRRRGAGITTVAVKASAGALLHLPVARVANVARSLARLREAGFWLTGLDVSGERRVGEAAPPPGRLALVLGDEGTGLSRLVREACDELVAIPLRGRVASLNVAVAAGVGLFAYAARRTSSSGG